MLENIRQSGGVLWGLEAVYFASVHHGLKGGSLLVVLCRIFATCTGVTACSVFPTIHGCSVSVFWCVYLSSIGAFGLITSASVSVSVTAAVVWLFFEYVGSVDGRFLGII